jgi:hypothetical protein
MENGRCRIHGGASLKSVDHPNYKHGMYDKYAPSKIKDKLDDFLEADPLDLTNELALTRALLAEFLSRFVEGTNLDAISISILSDLIDRVSKTVAIIAKLKNDSALTAAEVHYLQVRAVDVALKYFPGDKQKQAQFIADLFGVNPGSGDGRPELIEGQARRASR